MSSPTTEKTTMFLFPAPSCLEGDRLEQAVGALALGLLMRTFANEHSGGWVPADCVIQ